ncbi:MAG: type II toxin-antitoxin system HigB family toxin [Caldilineaceae bacterium]
MRIVSERTLREFWQIHPAAERPLRAWRDTVRLAEWKTPAEIKADYGNASVVANSRVVFNIKGNDYRLVAAVHYNTGILFVRFIGTHEEYDRVDVTTV